MPNLFKALVVFIAAGVIWAILVITFLVILKQLHII
jgi:hypothetical protein